MVLPALGPWPPDPETVPKECESQQVIPQSICSPSPSSWEQVTAALSRRQPCRTPRDAVHRHYGNPVAPNSDVRTGLQGPPMDKQHMSVKVAANQAPRKAYTKMVSGKSLNLLELPHFNLAIFKHGPKFLAAPSSESNRSCAFPLNLGFVAV